jgi:hypothetical protein
MLPHETREKLIGTAVRMEDGTAARRRDDAWLCGAGMQRMTAALEAMKQSERVPQEVPTPFGTAGRTFELKEAPGWTPTFVDREAVAAEEATARRNLAAALGGLLDRIAAAPG